MRGCQNHLGTQLPDERVQSHKRALCMSMHTSAFEHAMSEVMYDLNVTSKFPTGEPIHDPRKVSEKEYELQHLDPTGLSGYRPDL